MNDSNQNNMLKCFFRYKTHLADVIISYVKPIQQKIEEYIQEPDYLLDVLKDGSDSSREVAEKTIREVRAKLGIDFELKKEQRQSHFMGT